MKTTLLPYTAIDGISTFSDTAIRSLFVRMQDEDLVERVFYDGETRTPEDFLRMMKFGINRLFVIRTEDGIGGVCWLNNFDHRRAEFHFCFFSNLRGQDAVDVGKQAVIELLYLEDGSGNPLFDLLFGMTETSNIPAVKWCEAMGFETMGILPSAVWNAKSQ